MLDISFLSFFLAFFLPNPFIHRLFPAFLYSFILDIMFCYKYNVSIGFYKDKFDEILTGNLDQSLLSIFKKENKTLQDIEQFSIEKIYNHRAVVEIENAGYNVMYELLDHFIPSVIKENPKNYDKKALQLLPEQFRYEGEPYEKIMGVLDFVSGMTDNYATDLYRKIKGIDIGMTM